MKKELIVYFCIIVSVFLVRPAFSESYFGQVQYFAWPDPFYPKGGIVINQDAARAMFDSMVSAVYDPAEPDLESREPVDITLDDCEGKIGQNVTCRKIPRIVGNTVPRDAQGNVLYEYQCYIDLVDVTAGIVDTN